MAMANGHDRSRYHSIEVLFDADGKPVFNDSKLVLADRDQENVHIGIPANRYTLSNTEQLLKYLMSNLSVYDEVSRSCLLRSSIEENIPMPPARAVAGPYQCMTGKLLIFDHVKFSNVQDDEYPTREGSAVDVANLRGAFMDHLGYECEIYSNFTGKQVMEKVYEVSQAEDLKKIDILVIAINSHGYTNRSLLGSDGQFYDYQNLQDILSPQNCPTMAGKPKFFLINACRGRLEDPEIKLIPMKNPILKHFSSPTQCDFLIASSCSEGFVSYLHRTRGSAWVSALCDEIRKNSSRLDVVKMLTNVSRVVGEKTFPSLKGKKRIKTKQAPSYDTTLSTDVIMKPTSKTKPQDAFSETIDKLRNCLDMEKDDHIDALNYLIEVEKENNSMKVKIKELLLDKQLLQGQPIRSDKEWHSSTSQGGTSRFVEEREH